MLDVVEQEFSTVEGYVSAIIASKGNDAAVQDLILRIAKAGMLPQAGKIKPDEAVFKETDPDIIKMAIVDNLFENQKSLLENEKLKQELHAEQQAIEQDIGELKKILSRRQLELFNVYTLLWPQYPLLVDLARNENIQPNKLPVVLKYNHEIWIYGKDHKGTITLCKSDNPAFYRTFYFCSFCYLHNGSEITAKINQDIQFLLSEKHLQDKLEYKKSNISKTEEILNKLEKHQKQLILVARQEKLLPDEKHIDAYRWPWVCFGPYNVETIRVEKEVKAEIKKRTQQPEAFSAIEVERQMNKKGLGSLSHIFVSLKRSNYEKFKEDFKRNLCAILSRASEDEGRRLLIQHLQFSDLQGVNNVYGPRVYHSDFRGAMLSAANFSYSELAGGCFNSAMLQGADFSGSNLLEADFTEADLREADLTDTDLTSVNFTDADLRYAKLAGETSWAVGLGSGRPTGLVLDQLIHAKSLIGIRMAYAILNDKSRLLEEKQTFWEKLYGEYQMFFQTADDPEEISKVAFEISPHTFHPEEIRIYGSTLNQLNVILKGDDDDVAVCQTLLDLAYNRLVALLVSGGKAISEETGWALTHGEDTVRTSLPRGTFRLKKPGKYRDIFGVDQNKVDLLSGAIEINKSYHGCMAAINTAFEVLRGRFDDEKIQEVLVSEKTQEAFNNIIQLFDVDDKFSSRFSCPYAANVFNGFCEFLAELYGYDESSFNQTLIGLFLGSMEHRLSLSKKLLFYFADTLYKTKGEHIGFYEKDTEGKESEVCKWLLILALLADVKSSEAREIQSKVFHSLKHRNLKAGISTQSFEEMLSVACILNLNDLEDLYCGIGSNREEIASLLKTIKGKPIAIYEQAVLNPNQVELIQWPDDEPEKAFIEKLIEVYRPYRGQLEDQRDTLIAQLNCSISEKEGGNDLEGIFQQSFEENFSADTTSKIPVTLKGLIDSHDLKVVGGFLQSLEEGEEDNISLPPWSRQVCEMLAVLRTYIDSLNQIEWQGKYSPNFETAILKVLTNLNAVLAALNELNNPPIEGVEKFSELVKSFNLLDEAIQAIERMFNIHHKINSLPSQQEKCTAYAKAIQQLKTMQCGLYVIAALAVITSIVVGMLVTLPYIAIPLVIMTLALVIAEVTSQQKNDTMATLEIMPATFSGYLKTEFKETILPDMKIAYLPFFKQPHSHASPPQAPITTLSFVEEFLNFKSY